MPEAPPIAAVATDPAVPYVGLRAYTEEEAPLFFGREREAVELTRLVESDTVSILYGVSGVGKSSLLNAGLFPRLRQRDFLPVRLRLDHDEAAPPLAHQLQLAVHAAATAAGISGLPEPRGDESLWEYFHHPERVEFWTDDHRLLLPVLALDQFEEFFSLGHESQTRRQRGAEFRAGLLDLLENNPPPGVVSPLPTSAFRLPHFLLILREDFIAQLLPIVDEIAARLPAVHRQKLRLLPMETEAAREVIAGPARALGLEPPDEAAAAAIVRLAATPGGGGNQPLDGGPNATPAGGVEPARLALLLSALEAERRARDLPRITADLAASAGADLFARFVEQALEGQPEGARLFLEEQLVTPAGYRSVATADQAARFGVEEATLLSLHERRLLAARPGWPVRYELSHDLLCPPLRRSRDERQGRETERRAAETAAAARAKVRRAWQVALVAVAVAVVALGALTFALFARAEAEREKQAVKDAKAETDRQKTRAEAGEKTALTAKERAVASKQAADELVSFMQYDLRDTLGKLGALDMMAGINARIQRYHDEHPPEAGDQAATDKAERERSVALDEQGNILLARGDLAGALKSYRDGLAIAERLAAQDAANAGWQRDLSVSFNKVGEVQQAQGDLAGALKSYRDSLAIFDRLAAQDPANAGWQRNLSVSFNKVGEVQQAQGDLAGALKSYRDGLAIRDRLAAQDPANAGWQRDLSVSFEKVGDVQRAQGELAGALKSYRDGLAIRERLAAQDPANAGWQRDLSVSFEKVGDVQRAQGELAGALKSYRDGLAIRERLAAQDAANADWQRDLSVSFEKVGNVQQAQGELAGALKSYRDGLAIRERLAAQDAANADWQRDLSVSFEKVGNVQRAQGELAGALKSYRDGLAIRERLAAQDPANAGWQRDLSVSFEKVGDVQRAQGELAGALKSYRDGLAIRERLAAQDPANAGWQRDLSVSFEKVGDVQRAQGELAGALKSYRDGLAIRERLAAQDPANADWQRDLSISELKVGLVLLRQDKKAEASARFERQRQIMDRLAAAYPGNYQVQTDCAFARWKLADCADLGKSIGREEARRLLREAATILHGLEKSPGLQPKEAGWLRGIEKELAASKP